jgi:hypothetical protein
VTAAIALAAVGLTIGLAVWIGIAVLLLATTLGPSRETRAADGPVVPVTGHASGT